MARFLIITFAFHVLYSLSPCMYGCMCVCVLVYVCVSSHIYHLSPGIVSLHFPFSFNSLSRAKQRRAIPVHVQLLAEQDEALYQDLQGIYGSKEYQNMLKEILSLDLLRFSIIFSTYSSDYSTLFMTNLTQQFEGLFSAQLNKQRLCTPLQSIWVIEYIKEHTNLSSTQFKYHIQDFI